MFYCFYLQVIVFNIDGRHRRSLNFLWGALSSSKKLTTFSKMLTTFLVVAVKTQAKSTKLTTPTLPNLPHPAKKTILKI